MSSMSNIPREIEEEFLLRLPVKSISRFKTVCKNWYTLLCSREFVNQYDRLRLMNKNPRLLIRETNFRANQGMFYSIDYASISSASLSSSSTTCKCEGAVLMDDPMNGEVAITRGIRIFGSCNGVLCLGSKENRTLILWNPYTKECKTTILRSYWPTMYMAYGFGYDGKINKYKLVCIGWNEVIYACTLGLESDVLRNVCSTPYRHVDESRGLLLNGVLHWLVAIRPTEIVKAIGCFDVSTERFKNLYFPETLYQNCSCDLRVLGDSLCLVSGARDVRVDVWVMQNYGVTESWTKKFTTTQVTITSNPSSLKLYWSFENGEILIQIRQSFCLYDQMNDRVRLLNINCKDHTSSSFRSSDSFRSGESYVQSLFSLSRTSLH